MSEDTIAVASVSEGTENLPKQREASQQPQTKRGICQTSMKSPGSKKDGLAVRCIMCGHSSESSAAELIPDEPAATSHAHIDLSSPRQDYLIYTLKTSPHIFIGHK